MFCVFEVEAGVGLDVGGAEGVGVGVGGTEAVTTAAMDWAEVAPKLSVTVAVTEKEPAEAGE